MIVELFNLKKHVWIDTLAILFQCPYFYSGSCGPVSGCHICVPGFFEAFVEDESGRKQAAQAVLDKCKEGDSPLYRVESGWQSWPESAKEGDVLNWFVTLIDQLLCFAEEHLLVPRSRRRVLAQPHRVLEGSTANCELDVGFVDDPNAGADSKCHRSDILIPGELTSNPSADTMSKAWLDLSRYAR